MKRVSRWSPKDMSMRPDAGFTLVELLVVLIILGILSAIAIPVLVNQRAKARDAAVKADVSNLGKEIATYWIGENGPLALDYSTPGRVALTDGAYTTFARLTVGSTAPAVGAYARLDSSTDWCVALTDPKGDQKTYRYSGLSGLEPGACS